VEFPSSGSGPTALEAALDYRPDVVLLDIGLPKMKLLIQPDYSREFASVW
jgi:CheY-like chemotaxis protein